ncbi:2-(3-amino-3-carboxypropyl)histidine synthase [Cyberlindnera jadinii NRRL Y-1542]|uniref:2-(3-amino-3-carboxypropyl)histidine synthase subunit 2 n=1 Tax=Cyberlindnera jadinii (strain ATCC 18201 / CBS 1600 / BCRC 20928 / JCM 3617 / NBRC 0987 / NRRL Y-1542) TaxID=983966 RepID=A0A1E4RX19_CYBJN|nr:diphthamide biosynthesis protein [Cyberlindnera jadinii NRRL Y-1542]ODV71770.1 diphthamide biosynthesis protein [Cyberlindnera jadinii NRRL Y-1542]
MTDIVAPSLSTYQDDVTFQRYEESKHERPYLGPGWEAHGDLTGKLNEYYSIPELCEYLKQKHHGKKRFKKITLQFPDALVADSAIVVQLIQKTLEENDNHGDDVESTVVIEAVDHNDSHKHKEKDDCKKTCLNCKCSDDIEGEKDVKQQVWILADTAYSSCCIDEVAAGHVGSDIVVHFGDACLNTIQKLQAVYVFGKPYLELDRVVEKFKETYSTEDKVILMADAPYTRHLHELFNALTPFFANIAYTDIDLELANNAKIVGFESSSHKEVFKFSNRVIKGLEELQEDDLSEFKLFHITTPQPPHLLFLSTKFSEMTTYEPMDNSTNSGPFPSLMKRYRYMQMARAAGTIGILVNTLSLRNTNEVIKTVSNKIREAGKKHYMFVVGKPNVAKLANFESIELWCILGCGQGGIILDQSNEFYKPIITPYELEMALNPVVTWTGQWCTGFDELLKEEQDAETNSDEDIPNSPDSKDDDEDDIPQFNPVTGKLISTSRPLRQIQHLEIDAVSQDSKDQGQLVKAFSKSLAIKGTVSTSAQYLQNRAWSGLGSDFTDTDVDPEGAVVEQGRGGVARGYDFDIRKDK